MTASSSASDGINVVVVIQARTGSTRLPGKVLMPLAGAPLLERMVARVRRAATVDGIVVATTDAPSDDPIREICARLALPCYSGHPTDLLDRHYRAGLMLGADVVVKIPSDCPLIDPAVIDRVIGFYRANAASYDFVGNLHPATWPDGQDVEVMPIAVLEQAWREADRGFEREHTTPFIWERPERFRLGNVVWEGGRDYSMSHRWTIDYPEDYAFISSVYNALYAEDAPAFGVEEILDLLARHPEIADINAMYAGVNWYRHHLDELRTVDAGMTRGI